MTDLLFWCDFESTGLLHDAIVPTLLECAWTITDGSGTQLTPLRSVYTAIKTDGTPYPSAVVPELSGPDDDPVGYFPTSDGYGSGHYPNEIVRGMHETSGLTTGWALTANEVPSSILRDPIELDRLFLDDLLIAHGGHTHYGDGGPEPRVVRLAGCGVARFEAQFMPTLAPRAMGLGNTWHWHYRPADLSVELSNARLRGATGPNHIDDLIEHYVGDVSYPTWSKIEVDEVNRLVPDPTFTPDSGHRAATDVARALIAWRILVARGR